MLGAGLGATIGKAMAALLRWIRLALGCPSWEAAATALLLLWRRLLRQASPGDTAPWSELPPEMLGLVLSRLPSQVDRVRLRAVCRPWRSTPLPQPLPPPFPWMVLRDDTFVTLPDRALHSLPRHDQCCESETITRVCTGSTLFVANRCGHCCLVNPSSGETTTLKINLADYQDLLSISKVVLSDHIVAFMFRRGILDIFPREPRPGARHMRWEHLTGVGVPADTIHILDIALFKGELYALTGKYNASFYPGPQEVQLHLLNINDEQNRITSVQCLSAVAPCSNSIGLQRHFFFYLVASGDRLLLVERQILVYEEQYPGTGEIIRNRFGVWEAVDLIGGHGRWSKVDTLMGRVLFVGRECSESLPAQCGARENSIYFMIEFNPLLPRLWWRQGALGHSVVYNVRDKTMEPLAWETVVAERNGSWHPTWFFPADV